MKGLITVLVTLISLTVTAQRVDRKPGSSNARNIYGELGGPGVLSVNYDQRFGNKETGLGFRAGIGGIGLGNAGFISIPVGLNYLAGKEDHYFEAGAGLSVISLYDGATLFDNDQSTIFGFINLGYRYQPTRKGLTGRVFISPLLTSEGFMPFYGGVSLGFRF